MGSPWKMFTQAQGQELIDGTNSTWTTINGINGRKFTSKTDTSKYIFLPAGGYWYYTSNFYAQHFLNNQLKMVVINHLVGQFYCQ